MRFGRHPMSAGRRATSSWRARDAAAPSGPSVPSAPGGPDGEDAAGVAAFDTELDAAAMNARARTIVLDQLSAAPRTRAQLEDVLERKGIAAEVALAALDTFTELGYVDDEAFAVAWVQSRSASRGLARRALADELRNKGVPQPLAEAALDRLDPRAEEESARELIARKLASTRRLDRAVRERRALSLLARKGYPPTDALRLIREALASECESVDDDGWGES